MRKVSEKKVTSRQKNTKTTPKNIGKSVSAQQKPAYGKMTPANEKGKIPAKQNVTTSMKKQYLKSNGSCNVTFSLPKEAAHDAQVVTIVGDFNNWNLTETPMNKLKSGGFQLTLKLQRDMEYKFKYLIDAVRWENDWYADGYIPNAFGCDDSLVRV